MFEVIHSEQPISITCVDNSFFSEDYYYRLNGQALETAERIQKFIIVFIKTFLFPLLPLFSASLRSTWREVIWNEQEVVSNTRNISLKGERLTKVPCNLFSLEHMLSLDLSDNQLQDFSIPQEKIKNLRKLRLIDLQNNQLHNLPEVIFRCSKHCTILLAGNSIPEENMAKIKDRIHKTGYNGPKVHFQPRKGVLETFLKEVSKNRHASFEMSTDEFTIQYGHASPPHG